MFSESDMCTRQCCGPQRGFTIHITDNAMQVMLFTLLLSEGQNQYYGLSEFQLIREFSDFKNPENTLIN